MGSFTVSVGAGADTAETVCTECTSECMFWPVCCAPMDEECVHRELMVCLVVYHVRCPVVCEVMSKVSGRGPVLGACPDDASALMDVLGRLCAESCGCAV